MATTAASVSQSAHAAEPIISPTTCREGPEQPVLRVTGCRCVVPHPGHERDNLAAQMDILSLAENEERDMPASTPTLPSTPGTTISTPPATNSSIALSDTPRKVSSSSGTIEPHQKRRKEQIGEEIKDVKEELCLSCFFASFFPEFKEEAYRERTESLPLLATKPFKLTYPSKNPATPSNATRAGWPRTSNERAYYPPFAELLNEVLDHFNDIINPVAGRGIRFITYDKQMAPVTPMSLKPDMFLVGEECENLSVLHWKHPIIPVEVQGDFSDALKQLGTYTRELLSARPGRQFCLGFYFDHSRSNFRVILFNADRVHYTQSVLLTSAAGYRAMVKMLLSLISQPNILTIGEDTSRDCRTKLLPNGDRLEIRALEFDRKTIIGRRTRVVSAVVVGQDGQLVGTNTVEVGKSRLHLRRSSRVRDPLAPLNRMVFVPRPSQVPESPPPGKAPSRTRSRARSAVDSPDGDQGAHPASHTASSAPSGLQMNESNVMEPSYVLKDVRKDPYEVITFAGSRDHLDVGDCLIIKESWPLATRSDVEWDAFTSCIGAFGAPEVVYKVTGKHPMSVTCTQQRRVPQQIALKEKGLSLREASSPRILLTAVLHAIIGHWNLFRNGWLHRDISIGNVLMLEKPIQKLAPVGFEWLGDLTECQGIVIDGDSMIHSSFDRKPGSHRSCTLPFLSLRLVRAWDLGTKTFDQYFDDLESFAWVLVWVLIEIAEVNNAATAFDRRLMKNLTGDDLSGLAAGKVDITVQLKYLSDDIVGRSPKEAETSILDPFVVILDCWFDLIKAKRRSGKTETLPSNEDSTQLYKDFIAFAMERMDDLPDAWPFERKSN